MTAARRLRPPADFGTRSLPVRSLLAGHEFVRIHPRGLHPLHFSRGPGRWDDPAPGRAFGVCYLSDGATPWGAVAETLLHDSRTTIIEESDLESRALSRIVLASPIEVVTFHGSGLRRLGSDGSVTSGAHDQSRPWGAAIHAHPSAPAGIVWRGRTDDDAFSVAVFDRARPALALRETTPLLGPELLPAIASWLDRYRIAVA